MNVNKRYRLFFMLGVFALFTGCIHEFPDDNPVDPSLIDVDITLSIDMLISQDVIYQTYAPRTNEGDYDIRYIVDIYEPDPNASSHAGQRVKRLVKTEETPPDDGTYHWKDTIKLSAKKYQLITWIDFVEKGTNVDKYYHTDDLHNVSIITNGQYQGYTTTRDAFSGREEMDLTPYKGQRYVHYSAEMEVIRPFAIYQIVTTDIEAYKTYHQTSYASIQPAQTNIQYNLFFPMGHNTWLQTPIDFRTGIRYSYDILEETVPAQEAIIASDYVFVKGDAFYMVDFQIYTAEGKPINAVSGLRINLRQNHITIVKDEFLTKDLGGGSIGISDGFEDEIVIQI